MMGKPKLVWDVDSMSDDMAGYWRVALWNLVRSAPHIRPFVGDLTENLKIGIDKCESPIEVSLFVAIMAHNWGTPEKPILTTYCDNDTDFAIMPGRVKIAPQCGFFGRRMDFAMSFARVGTPVFLAVEADGKDYHNTYDDSKRDNELKSKGVRTLRFTGSDIHRDPKKCADNIKSCAQILENGGAF